MAFNWYRRMKLGFDLSSRRHCISKITAPKPLVSITNHSNQLRSTLNYQPVSVVTKLSSHIGCSGYRCYHVNPQLTVTEKKLMNVTKVLVVLGGLITWIVGDVETIPFTKRKHFLLMPQILERDVGESQFQRMKDEYEGKVLAVMHPERVRVAMILNQVIQALQTGLNKERSESGVAISHMEWLQWEVLVVKDDAAASACCLPGGKLVVSTGLLDRFSTDEEIATIIAHEVAHVVARHVAERFTKNFVLTGRAIFYSIVWPDRDWGVAYFLLDRPYSRRMEIEADYIGLQLMASAGYDPQVAPKVLEKLGRASGDLAFRDYFSIHRMGKTRSESLCEASVMQEAISLYEEAKHAGVEVDT